MKPLSFLLCGTIAAVLFLLVRAAGHIDLPPGAAPAPSGTEQTGASVARVNEWLQQHWQDRGLSAAPRADDLTIYRRLSLALHGTIPSLEEIRSFTADSSEQRIERWLNRMLRDSRFADYFAERLTRMLVGNEEGNFFVYRRDRLRDWLIQRLQQDAPWSDTVTLLISGDGLWTQDPWVNFVSTAYVDDEGLDENKLAGKTVRAFLGQRIDCAQCHDHFFADWKQEDFEGLAAFYGQTRINTGGVLDHPQVNGAAVEYQVVDPGAETGRVIVPRVPFHAEWLPQEGSRRTRLAGWVVHADNRRFRRAVANRIWGLMFGRAWSEPVDDLPDPDTEHDLLDVMAEEFANHDDSLKSLIRMVALSDAFLQQSRISDTTEEDIHTRENHWAVFPLVRLRPEQVIGSMFQAGSILTIDQKSHVLTRFSRFFHETDFLKEYGEVADDELLRQTGTIPQALLRMNGSFTRDLTAAELLRSSGQLLSYSPDDEAVVVNSFLACLSRQPTSEEQAAFVRRLQSAGSSESGDTDDQQNKAVRQQAVEDLFWVLFNATEFSWNH